ncbi:MAG: ribonuclease Z [Syntrophobacteraceae bacterium]
MDCTLVGTGGMMPMPYRMLVSLAVRLNGKIYLFDAGEGVQINWKKARIGVSGLRLIAVTHLHADHCLGIPGILMLKAQMDDPEPLTIIGPPGTREFVMQFRKTLEFQVNYPIHFIEWPGDDSGVAYADERARILWEPLKHTRFCLGYRFEELDRPGRFDPSRAEALGVPKGPLWGRLQSGNPVTTPAGAEVRPDEVLGPSRRGRHVAYVVDTRPAPGIYSLCRDTDLTFIEGMFLDQDSAHAVAKGHLTVTEAARIAKESRAGRAILVHISPRYENSQLGRLEEEARTVFQSIKAGRDLDYFEVKLPEN